jgi:hypothetical protein
MVEKMRQLFLYQILNPLQIHRQENHSSPYGLHYAAAALHHADATLSFDGTYGTRTNNFDPFAGSPLGSISLPCLHTQG